MNQYTGNRILMLLENLPFRADVRVKQEAIALARRGYQVSVICPNVKGGKLHETVDGVDLYQFPAPREGNGLLSYAWEYGYSTIAMWALSVLVLLRRGFDVIHVHNPPDVLIPAMAFYKLLGKRLIYDHHDLAPEAYNIRFTGDGNRLVFHVLVLLEKLSYRLADHVIATNESYKAVAMERGRVPEERITIVRNGPTLEFMDCHEQYSHLKQDGKKLLVYAGRIGAQDGADHMIRALHHLVYDLGRTDFVCLVVGTGTAVPELKSLTEQLSLDPYVSFTGWVEQDKLIRYLRTADICVAPEPSNPYNDRSTVVKMVEYLAAQKPVVAFDLPEHRFTAGDAALYAHPNEDLDLARQIVQLMDAPDRRAAMGQIGEERIRTQLAWPHQEKHLLQAYDSLISLN